jgi:WD40 repeat protein
MTRLLTVALLVVVPAAAGGRGQAQPPKVRTTLDEHRAPVSSVAFSPDGKTLPSGSADCTIKLWELPATMKAGK